MTEYLRPCLVVQADCINTVFQQLFHRSCVQIFIVASSGLISAFLESNAVSTEVCYTATPTEAEDMHSVREVITSITEFGDALITSTRHKDHGLSGSVQSPPAIYA